LYIFFVNKDFISYDKLVYVFNAKRSAKVDFSCHNPLPLKNNFPITMGMAININGYGETGNMTGLHKYVNRESSNSSPKTSRANPKIINLFTQVFFHFR
jgi:hypothetical protein